MEGQESRGAAERQGGPAGTQREPRPVGTGWGAAGQGSFPFWSQLLPPWPDRSAAKPSKSEKKAFPQDNISFCHWLSSVPAVLEAAWPVLDWNWKWSSYNILPHKASGTWKPWLWFKLPIPRIVPVLSSLISFSDTQLELWLLFKPSL